MFIICGGNGVCLFVVLLCWIGLDWIGLNWVKVRGEGMYNVYISLLSTREDKARDEMTFDFFFFLTRIGFYLFFFRRELEGGG